MEDACPFVEILDVGSFAYIILSLGNLLKLNFEELQMIDNTEDGKNLG
jgi:hypothetical protein